VSNPVWTRATNGPGTHTRVHGARPNLRPEKAPFPTALVVEDDFWLRMLVNDLLCAAGYQVLEASNGSAALRLARREPLTLVLLDLILPELSGLDVLVGLKQQPATSHVPVIVMSGDPAGREAAQAWATAVVPKPFAVVDLLAEIASAAGVPSAAPAHTGLHARGGCTEIRLVR
jgi:two-component system, chemotaxis family, chemotaxis protein CheY